MSIKVTWYSHASFLIETDQARLLVDPFITDNPLAPVKVDEVQADYIFIPRPR
jgi:L-ascorbate metabolism protein UlaG (beta-lactamase superfamily)